MAFSFYFRVWYAFLHARSRYVVRLGRKTKFPISFAIAVRVGGPAAVGGDFRKNGIDTAALCAKRFHGKTCCSRACQVSSVDPPSSSAFTWQPSRAEGPAAVRLCECVPHWYVLCTNLRAYDQFFSFASLRR